MEQTKYDIFISYSRKDKAVADRICSALEKYGISFFIDRKGIGGGMEFPAVLADAIINSKIMLFLGSANSYKSKFTNSEVTFAFNEKPMGSIIPYIIDKSTLPPALKFTFSSINIRTIEEHPIETILMQDLCQILGIKYIDVMVQEEQKEKEEEEKGQQKQHAPVRNKKNAKAARKKDVVEEESLEKKTDEDVDSRGCLAALVLVFAEGGLAYWLGDMYHSYWITAGVFVSLAIITIWSCVQWDEYAKLPNIKDDEKREAMRVTIIRDLICFNLIGVFFGVAVAIGLWQDSFWIGLIAWLAPSFIAISYAGAKDDN